MHATVLRGRLPRAFGVLLFCAAIGLVAVPATTVAQSIDNQGTEFFVTFLPNYSGGGQVELHLTAAVATTATVEYPINAPTFTNSYPLTPGTITIVALPTTAASAWTPGAVSNNAVRITAPEEVVAYMINRVPYTSDAAVALPIDTFNTEYIVASYSGVSSNDSEFAVVAAYDNTEVTITPSQAMVGGHAAGVPFAVTLNRGEAFFGYAADLTGTIVSATRPVGMTNGNRCTNVPSGVSACDHIFEVAPPVQTWGLDVLAANLPNRPSGSIYRALAATDGTTVSLDGAVQGLINRGQFLEIGPLAGDHLISGSDQAHGDEEIAEALMGEESDIDEALSAILNATICRALAHFDFALETGEPEPIETARALLTTAVSLAGNAGNVPLWWISNLCRHLIDDLWQHSLHENLPTEPPEGTEEKYPDLRRLFISSLYARKTSEVELWPSQREAARRSTDVTDDLVVALPTSAGKTRVAEIAALMTLSSARRVLIVTPLRALSAQTERSFRKTFAPLGFSVSSLYGASGLSVGDEDALRTREIIIATPEKLDFALRSDPSLIDNVGLIVLDEGHMIGPSEREIRYETLVQRLLRRADAGERRIVCLSAILPSGDELDDLTAWIRSDEPGEPVRSDWRPTRQRFGALTWRGKDALLRLDLDDDGPFLDKFVVEKAARGKEKKPYPRKNSHLALFAAWEFAGQGKRTLIFSTQANWVESYGKQVVDLCKRGYLDSLLEDEASVARALEVGKEWLGEDHPAVACLKGGVAIHHGRLPSPFLRELEALLSEGVLKVIVASPTLSQGLNLNAAVLLVPALYRASEKIKGEEFANVAGRAGRAFVDVEGLIVHVMFDKVDWRKKEWRKLVASAKARTLKSGLIQIVAEILERLAREGVLDRDDAWEYLANAREAWRSPEEEAEVAERLATGAEYDADGDDDEGGGDDEEETIEEEPLSQIVERLDATVFGLIEALDSDRADLPKLLDEALKGSLWARQIAREDKDVAPLHKKVFEARADLIWKTATAQARRGHFAMGVGLEAGLKIDAMADELAELLDRADDAALSGGVEALVDALGGLGERLLFMRPFIPDKASALPVNWKAILRSWVSGEDVAKIGPQNMRVVEDAFTYRLVWALEAIRTRRMSLGWSPETVAGGAAAAVETGVPQFMMSMLIRAGLPSRRAAMAAIEDAKPVFVTPAEMRAWLESDELTAYTDAGDWPTPDTAALWARFRTEALSGGIQKWSVEHYKRLLDIAIAPPAGLYRIVTDEGDGRTWLTTPDYQRVAAFKKPAVDPKPSLFSGRLPGGTRLVEALRVGRGKLRWPSADA